MTFKELADHRRNDRGPTVVRTRKVASILHQRRRRTPRTHGHNGRALHLLGVRRLSPLDGIRVLKLDKLPLKTPHISPPARTGPHTQVQT